MVRTLGAAVATLRDVVREPLGDDTGSRTIITKEFHKAVRRVKRDCP